MSESFERAEPTDKMKADCMGEFSLLIEEPCPKCVMHLDYHYEGVYCLCEGSEEQTYFKKIVIPWDTCKKIWKAMNKSYAQ